MIPWVVACLAAGAITFQPQELPGLVAGPVLPFAARHAVNCRQADLNGDGLADLVFAAAWWMQQGGTFPPQQRQPLPPAATGALIDIHGGSLYCVKGARLLVLGWREGALAEVLNQELDWPAGPTGSETGLGRFLQDIDGNGMPELIAVDEHAVTVFASRDGRYEQAARLRGVLPELRYMQLPEQPLWPKSRRALSFPARQRACDLVMDGAALSVVYREAAQQGQFVFLRETRTLTAQDGKFGAAAPGTARSAPVPDHVRPCRLNGDGALHLAGCRRADSTGRTVPVSMVETWASLDGGGHFAVRRAAAPDRFLPPTPLVDFDGDGLTDLVTESTGLFEGGTREVVERFMTRASVGHTVLVYRQRDGGFTEKPDFAFQAQIALEAPPWRLPPMYARYQAGTLVNLCGDFDGDGRHDIAVRDRKDRVALWLTRDGAYASGPEAVIRIGANAEFAVSDINGDGRSDLIETRETSPSSPAAERAVTVHFAVSAGGGAP